MNGFKISKHLKLPPEAVAWVIGFLAKRNAGKTYNAADLCEEMLKAKIPVIVIDGMSVWWGLRSGKDGTGSGLPIVILGGEHADIKLDPTKIEKVVEALLQTNTSAVLDIGQLRKGEQMRVVTAFVEELYRLAFKYPAERHVFIEEADMFAPQKPFKEESRCLGAFEDLVKRGGNRNLGCTLITQRSASLNKNVLTQADCLVIGRTTAPQDKAAIQAWVEKHSEKDKHELEEWYDSLNGLKKGEAWVWNADEEWNIFKKVQFRERETFHATRKFMLTKHAQQIKLMDATEFIEKFKDKFEPKPTPKPVSKPEPHLVPEKATYDTKHKVLNIPIEPPVTFKSGETKRLPVPTQKDVDAAMETVRVNQTLPNIMVQQFKPTIQLSVETLQEPTSALGRVCVVLKNDAQAGGRQDAWTTKRITTHIRNHAWDDAGVEDAVNQLIRWEILRKQSNNYLRFYPQRIQVSETQTQMEV
ncbi:MAG: hypothetical protein UT24_C0003G0059 [Candidatus Woesebacteria bacterium GW2011_GWB1_39_12]|uniref:Helicase HerA central domain-containing protein n=1 Tax=Candidatus Woesebacteria bacterium GW2011_GWB1_39_12 TaxID=1618574 RepID=A0A0G0QIZ2_9BACT|nr:MAG: hypothetical protein UT24_C0003G0059 [Candidatus Woesebacteria bacterium GW2011_GWB1_39_12]